MRSSKLAGFVFTVVATSLVPVHVTVHATPDSATEIVSDSGDNQTANRDALVAAVRLMPRAPKTICVMDVTRARPDVVRRLLMLDAFTVKGNSVIYVAEQSQLMAGARAGSPLYRAILATVLWHEMAHVNGADERGARKAEEDLWMRFVRDGVTDQVTALRYLQMLQKRADDWLPAMLARADPR